MTREEAIHRLKNTAWLGTNKDREETEQAVDMAIEALSADAVQGEWIFNTDENNGKSWNICSVCGYSIFHTTKFCPNCGAKMKGGDDE